MRPSELQSLIREHFSPVEGFLAAITSWADLPSVKDELPRGFHRVTICWSFDYDPHAANLKPTPEMQEDFRAAEPLDWNAEEWPLEAQVDGILARFAPHVRGMMYLKRTIDAEEAFVRDPQAQGQYWEFFHLGNASARSVTFKAEAAARDPNAPPGSVLVVWGPGARDPQPEPALVGAADEQHDRW